jgi:hypothetical protein
VLQASTDCHETYHLIVSCMTTIGGREEQAMKAWVCAKCWTNFPKDADFCPVCGAPRREMSLLLFGSIVVPAMAALVLFFVDLATGSTSMLLGFLPGFLFALAGADQVVLDAFVTKKAGRAKYLGLLWVALGLLYVVISLTSTHRHWP